ncbi:hypothetical protein [Mesorhizobium shangrilense]|uniref:Uncharacterized protein n=1 Tax=Mesorhizobium shangrilense TaxID=460060 RepID=A0ABV2D6F6_9HYPH
MDKADIPPSPGILVGQERGVLWRQSTIIAPHEPGWHWSPGTANMYRRSHLQRARPMLDVVNASATDNYFMPFVHALGGSACIDIPLSAYRIHGKNRFGEIPSLSGLRTTGVAASKRSATHRRAMIKALAARARDFVATHPQSFWTLMDAPAACDGVSRQRYFTDPAIQEILADHYGELIAACGEAQTNSELRTRMGAKAFAAFLVYLRTHRQRALVETRPAAPSTR